MNIHKAFNSSSEYSVFQNGEYIGFVYAVPSRKWASVCRPDREIIAFVCGFDKVEFGAELLN